MYIDNSIIKNTFNKYTASHIANFFLLKAQRDKVPDITAMKLAKLVYIAYAWYYAISKQRLFKEKIESWRYGPVVPSIYHEFKRFGNQPIEGFSISDSEDLLPLIDSDDHFTGIILLRVWKKYKNISVTTLIEITHEDKELWYENYDEQLKLMADRAEEAIVKLYGQGGLHLKEDIEKYEKENHG